ncbi:MAG: LuxR C-terminal-related transcriptional regulator [Nocardiopsaceae bacterium]|nr:LuxR C-terminal-related transcriptional regulator [Nocardiopsaceae bacterium]
MRLLTTKLHVPRLRPGFVPRPRLLGALDEGVARRLIMLCAPAGFGKTALLAEWAWQGERPAAWLSLDAGDNDPARFWRYVVAALDRTRPGIAERVGPLLGPPSPSSFEGPVTAIINELATETETDAGGDREVLLVLDDYHVIDAQPVHNSLEFLLEHLPPELRLVMASRSDPPLPLARLRASGQLAELRSGDLRFSTQESAALLNEAIGGDLPAETVEALAARTEGWAVGLQLAAMSLRGRPDTASFVADFSGSHRYVLDYLAEEVLERQSEEVRTFLLETSVLERLSGGLCDAVTGRADSQAMLERIERANLFLIPLDEMRGWWRYHHLFADLLQARLQQERPGRAVAVHRNAAVWHETHGHADDAIRHALGAGDAVWAARLIEKHADELIYLRGEGTTVLRWLATLPREVTDARPRLLLTQAALALLSRRAETVEGLLDAASRAFANADKEPFEPSVGQGASLLGNLPAAIALGRTALAQLRGDADSAVTFGSQALAELDGREWLLGSMTRGYLARSELMRGRLTEAEEALSSVIGEWLSGGASTYVAWGYQHLGQVQRAQGRLTAAARTYQEAVEVCDPGGRPVPPAAGAGYVGLAEVAYQRDELADAERHVAKGISLCRPFVSAPPLSAGLATLAWIRQAKGDAAGAREAMGEAEEAAPGLGVPGLLNPGPSQHARLLLAQGDVAAAASWVQEHGLTPDDQPGYLREPEYLVLARVLLAERRPGQSRALLDRLRDAAAAQGRTGSMIEIQALLALALSAAGDDDGALAALAAALVQAVPEGYVRVFADEGAPMAALLIRLAAAQKSGHAAASRVEFGHLARVLRAVGSAAGTPGAQRHAAAVVPGLVEQLTPREHEVLALLATGASNPRIAADLVVSLDTAKKHVSHLMSKLGATNRTEAVAHARQLGLIP